MKDKIINAGGINGTGTGYVDTNAKDFKDLQAQIIARSKQLSPEEKRDNILLSIRFQMESYLYSNNNEIKDVGKFIKDLINLLNIKNQDLAQYMEYEASNMSAFLNGKRKLNLDLAIKLGKTFKINPSLLLNVQNKNELKKFGTASMDKYLNYNIEDLLAKAG